jgi:DNA-binding winged helix-turn-helix (wHTH) protein
MDEAVLPMRGIGALAGGRDFQMGSVLVSPSRRIVESTGGTEHLQPQAMLVLMCLAENQGRVVPRSTLFERCWGGAPVGDDSINQAISAIRQSLLAAGADIVIETVPRAGYRLLVPKGREPGCSGSSAPAVEAAYDCWRLGWPRSDAPEIAALEAWLARNSSDARGWGILALLLRKAAEYARAAECSAYVSRCQVAAREALNRDPDEPNARVALAGLTPLFGNWSTIRAELLSVLDSHPGHAPALHDLLFLEMATGRPSVSLPMLERLLAEDRFAATYYYKAMYQMWTVGRLVEAEQLAARAIALWPRHPANWLARFWVLVGTGRAEQARLLVADEESRPDLPPPILEFLERTAHLAAARDAGECEEGEISDHVAQAVRLAALGPANAIASIQTLCVLDALDEAFEVADGYYLGRGGSAVPLRWNAADPPVTDQYRRVTQLLFIPLASRLREDGRFMRLCDETGLSAYWDQSGVTPDFRR